jgi:hypothetical protein
VSLQRFLPLPADRFSLLSPHSQLGECRPPPDGGDHGALALLAPCPSRCRVLHLV